MLSTAKTPKNDEFFGVFFAREHFKALNNEIDYDYAKDWQKLKRDKV